MSPRHAVRQTHWRPRAALWILVACLSFVAPARAEVVYGTAGGGTGDSTLVRIDTDALSSSTIGSVGFHTSSLAFGNDGQLYAVDHQGDQLLVVDPVTGAGTVIGSLGIDPLPSTGLANDLVSDTLFATTRVAGNNDFLVTISKLTGAATSVGATGAAAIVGLSFDESGQLWALDGTGFGLYELIRIDKNTAARTVVGSLALPGSPGIGALNIGPAGTFRTIELVTSDLVEIDPLTGAGTAVGVVSGLPGGGIGGLASRPIPATCLLPALQDSTGTGTGALATGDLDADLLLDIVTADFTGGTTSVLLGKGDGSYQTAVSYATGPVSTLATDITPVDLDGDRVPDLVVTGRISDTLSVLLGNGDGTVQTAATVPTGLGPAALAVADLDGDAFLDVVTANFSADEIGVLLGDGAGGFASSVGYSTGALGLGPFDVALGDLDGDTALDAVTGNSLTAFVSVLLGNGNGSFAAATPYPSSGNPETLALGDLDRDGAVDIVAASIGSGDLSILLGNGDGSFQAPNTIAVGGLPAGLALRDINDDGRLDVLAALNGSSQLVVLRGRGDGTFRAPDSFAVGSGPADVIAVDLDDNASPDVVTANSSASNVSTLLNCVAFVDTDGDGIPDSVEDTNANGSVDPGETDPLDRDSDDDGLSDSEEDIDRDGIVDPGETNAANADTDADGLQDGTEVGATTGIPDPDGGGPLLGTNLGTFVPDLDPLTTTDPLNPDTDGDGLLDGSANSEDLNDNGRVDPGETDPSDFDTDDDGFSDGIEVGAGTDPLDPMSFPGSMGCDSNVVVPNARAASEGGSGGFNPFSASSSRRYQQVFLAAEFPCAGLTRQITHVRLRPNAGQGAASWSIPDLEVRVSTSSAAPDSLSTTFANNVGADETLVFSGALAISTAPSGATPENFDVVIPFDPPFPYDPAGGNLLIDLTHEGVSGSGATGLDADLINGDAISRVLSFSSGSSSGGAATFGFIMQFQFEAPNVPALSGGGLLGLAALLAIAAARRLRSALR